MPTPDANNITRLSAATRRQFERRATCGDAAHVAPRGLRRVWPLVGADIHLLKWLSFFAGPLGTSVRRISVVIARCARRGLIDRRGTHIRLTALGHMTLLCERIWREQRRRRSPAGRPAPRMPLATGRWSRRRG